jgi:hypothetical protein
MLGALAGQAYNPSYHPNLDPLCRSIFSSCVKKNEPFYQKCVLKDEMGILLCRFFGDIHRSHSRIMKKIQIKGGHDENFIL